MPAKLELNKKQIVKTAVKMINENGLSNLNARSLAKNLGVSTKPLYRVYTSMEEIKKDTYEEIYRQYDEYLKSRVDSKKALVTLCIAYVEFAREYPNLFITLFLSNNLNWQSIDNVLDEKWNQGTIINLVNKHGYTFDDAKKIFMNMWLYATGLATLLATNDLKLDEEKILVKLVGMYKILVK